MDDAFGPEAEDFGNCWSSMTEQTSVKEESEEAKRETSTDISESYVTGTFTKHPGGEAMLILVVLCIPVVIFAN